MNRTQTSTDLETKHVAKELAHTLTGGEVLALSGDLGAGKTTFTQGIAEYFNIAEHASSPTFTLINVYNVSGHKTINNIIHIDSYRLESPEELQDIGIEEYFRREDVVVIIEWAEKVREVLPPRTRWIEFSYGEGEDERVISLM